MRRREEHSALRVELAALEERNRSEKAAMARLESQWKERARAARGDFARDRAAWDRAGASAGRQYRARPQVRRIGRCRCCRPDSEVNRLATQETELRAALGTGEESLKAIRAQLDAAREKRSAAEVELVKLQAELKFLDETSRKELNSPISELAQGDGSALDDAGLAEAERGYQEIKAKIEAMGPVNPQALEEFQEAQQRYDFLNAQRQDLLDSIRDTEKAIHEIDTVSRQKFAEHSRRLMRTSARRFRRCSAEGPARCGSPTRLIRPIRGSISSRRLRGRSCRTCCCYPAGEKALDGAVAADGDLPLSAEPVLYPRRGRCTARRTEYPATHPAAEGDVALETQFILITHSRKTMEAAQAMYGVTMQEPGVSKLGDREVPTMPPPPPTAGSEVEMAL